MTTSKKGRWPKKKKEEKNGRRPKKKKKKKEKKDNLRKNGRWTNQPKST